MRCDVVRCDVVRCGGVGTPQLGSFSTKLLLVVGNKTWTTVPQVEGSHVNDIRGLCGFAHR